MIKPNLKHARTPLLVLVSASLLAGCTEIKSGMNRIQDRISQPDTQNTDEGKSGKNTQMADRGKTGSDKQKRPALECPDIKIIDELGTVHKFTDMTPPTADKLISTAQLESLQHECRITDQGKGQVDLYMTFESTTGPASHTAGGKNQEIGYPYFVAVTDKQGAILSKDVFELAITPSSNTGVITARENIRQIIPVDRPQELGDYSIAIGFQMSDAQLEYNRKNKRETELGESESLTPDQGNKAGEDARKQIRNMQQ